MLDPPIIESHSAQWIVASVSYKSWAKVSSMNELDNSRNQGSKQIGIPAQYIPTSLELLSWLGN